MVTDAVLHIWNVPLNPEYHVRTKPTSGEQLLAEMDRAGVDRAVLVPPREIENDYAVDAARRHGPRFRAMPVIDPRRPDLGQALLSLAAEEVVVGFRVVMHTPELARIFDAGGFDDFWNHASGVGLPVALFAPQSVRRVEVVARRHPTLRLLVDHLGLPLRVMGHALMPELKPVLELADLPNVAVKASGLPTHSELPFPFVDVGAPLNALLDAFGPDRVFWGSDLTRLSCSYREAVEMMPAVVPDDLMRRRLMGEAFSDWIRWPADGA
jgi:predicted TIM-barrel fold metal-dependent hydrolase